MEPEDNAGGASVSDSTPMTVREGEDKILSLLDGGEKTETAEQPAAPEAPSEPEAEQAEDVEAAASEPEDQALDFEKLHGNTRLRLRDGTEVTVGELKKRYGDLQELPRHRQEFEAQRQEFQARQAQFAQQEQFVAQTLPLAVQMATKYLPPEPDPSLLYTDPNLHYAMQEQRKAAVAELQEVHNRQVQAKAQWEQQRNQSLRSYVEQERQQLMQAMPELKDEKARVAFQTEIVATAKAYGFTDQDVGQVYDHRLLKMAKDAAAYRKLMSEKPKVEAKVQSAPPVQAPGRRVSAPEQRGRDKTDKFKQLRETGDRRLGEAILRELL